MPLAKDKWRRIEEICLAAMECPPEQRAAFIREACGSDPELASEVESLLAHEKTATFLDHEGMEFGARLLASEGRGLLAGKQFGPYHLLSLLGAGGMGEVYLAEDARLARQVAVKVLPRWFSSDVARKQRFVREARAASALNHPNIVTVHDIGEAEGTDYIVLEHIQGETLSKRIEAGAMPFADAAPLAIQIADALVAAHAAGIVHRDLKPGNVMVTTAGLVKVLDFGLAKQAPGSDPKPATDLTSAGAIIGTVAYMAPEQAKGNAADARSDIFSFGAMLYEMLTGQRAFAGHSNVSTLAAVLSEDPKPVRSFAKLVPREVEKIVSRCLAKDPAERWQTMAEVRFALEAALSGASRAGGQRWAIPAAVTALVVVAAGMAWWTSAPWRAGLGGANHAMQLTNYPGEVLYPTLSPDGLRVAFTWSREGEADIFIRAVDSNADPVRLTTEHAKQAYARWSPDGHWIAYTTGTERAYKLKIIPAAGGAARELGPVQLRPIDWTPDSKRILATPLPDPDGHSRFVTVSRDTGEVHPIPYEADKWEKVLDTYPAVSPDGARIAFSRTNSAGNIIADVYTVNLDGGVPRRLTNRQRYISGLTWTPDGREIIFQSFDAGQKALFRIPADASPETEPQRVLGAGDLGHYPAFAGKAWSGAPRLAYSRVAGRRKQIVRIDFQTGGYDPGNFRVVVGPRENPGSANAVVISRDCREVAFAQQTGAGRELYVAPAKGGAARQVTFCSARALAPGSWSPDGSRIIFSARLPPNLQLFSVNSVSSQGGPSRAVIREPAEHPVFSPDGNWIYFRAGLGPASYFRVPAHGGPYPPAEWKRITAGGPVMVGVPANVGNLFVYTRGDRAGIFAVPAEGGRERVLLSKPVLHALWAAGTYIYYLDVKREMLLSTAPKPLRRLDIRSGDDELVASIPLRLRSEADAAETDQGLLSIAPDGSFAVLVQAIQAADLMLVDRFR